MQLLWLIAAIILFIVEAIVPGLVCIWFALGAVAAMIASFFVANTAVQTIVFIFVSAVLLLSTRSLVRKFLSGKTERTNVDRIIGQDAIVTETIDNLKNTGRVSICGLEWKAASVDKTKIEKGSVVTIRDIRGVTARVIKKEI